MIYRELPTTGHSRIKNRWGIAVEKEQVIGIVRELLNDGLIVMWRDDHLNNTDGPGVSGSDERQYWIDSNGIDHFGQEYLFINDLLHLSYRKLTPHEIVILKKERNRRKEIEAARVTVKLSNLGDTGYENL